MTRSVLIFFLVLFVSSSCIVTKKKYDDMLAQKVKTEGELAEKSKQLEQANADLDDLNKKLAQLKEDTTSLGIDYRTTSQKLDVLNKEYEQLNSYYKNLLNNSGKLNRDLTQQKEQLLAIQRSEEHTSELQSRGLISY